MSKALSLLVLALAVGCARPLEPAGFPAPAPQPTASAATTNAAADDARAVCKRVMLRTRECGELYVPALVRTRVRFDQPPGIAARYKSVGEEQFVEMAREEFKTDWSDPSIAVHCDKLAEMPEARRSAVVEREASCLPVAGDCAKFVECNMANLERKWTPLPPSSVATPP